MNISIDSYDNYKLFFFDEYSRINDKFIWNDNELSNLKQDLCVEEEYSINMKMMVQAY